MDQEELNEEMKKVEISDIEVVKMKSAYDRATLFLYKAGLQLIVGNTDNFIKGVMLVELILKPKLDPKYIEKIDVKRKEMSNDPEFNELLDLALFKYGELNNFIDKQIPIPIQATLV